MKAKEIQELLDFIAKSGLEEVNVETDTFKVSVKKTSSVIINPATSQNPQPTFIQQASQPIVQNTQDSSTQQKEEKAQSNTTSSNLITIKSPMIGTFYRSANPDSPVFVSIGDEVKQGQIVCIIEAMKLFNEIESEVSGKIVKVLVDNASPVEYDQPLFLVEPN